jgi:transposase-like protein
MANKKSYRVPKEIKAEIIRKVKEEGISVAQAAKDYGISNATIYAWLGTGASGSPSWSEFIRLQKQCKELFEVVGELTVQLSQAKKKN